MSFFQTTEFYVILFLAAMAIVAFIAIPHTSGPVSEYLIGSTLSSKAQSPAIKAQSPATLSSRTAAPDSSDFPKASDFTEVSTPPYTPNFPGLPKAPDNSGPLPVISIDCDDSGAVWLRRTGLNGVDATGAVSAKVVVKGFNITVYERIVEGRYGDNPVDTALFELDFLAPERYYLRYESEATNSAATLAFRNTPGYHAHSPLKQ